MKPHTTITDDLDVLAFVFATTGTAPAVFRDNFTGRAVAEIPAELALAFLADAQLQRFSACKRAIFREVRRLRAEAAAAAEGGAR